MITSVIVMRLKSYNESLKDVLVHVICGGATIHLILSK